MWSRLRSQPVVPSGAATACPDRSLARSPGRAHRRGTRARARSLVSFQQSPVVLMYTGGTTGLPKGALLTQRSEMLNLYHVAVAIGLGEGRVYLHQTPMFHAASVAAILGVPAQGGVSVFIPLFKPGDVIALIKGYT